MLNLFACKVSCKAVSGRGRVSRLATAVIGNASGSEASRSHAVSLVYIDPRGACSKRRVAGVVCPCVWRERSQLWDWGGVKALDRANPRTHAL